MTRSPAPLKPLALLLAALWNVVGVGAAVAQEIVFRAFGDSITVGYGDTSALGGGYPTRLERWLRQEGHDVVVHSHGVGGETTAEGLSRIDAVLGQGGDFLLLMEGTNDISKRMSLETIVFNLDEMATRAEDLGMVAVHASVIPRIPTAPADGNNAKTEALATELLELGAEKFRAVADVFHAFEELPDLFENYYYYNSGTEDIVGHPNTAGYIEMAGVFLETVLPLLDGPQLQVLPPEGPVSTGILVSFSAVASESIVRVEWDFGDGGQTTLESPGSFDTFYLYREPGTYLVTARGFTAEGASAFDSVQVTVSGSPLAWSSRVLLFPAATSSGDGLVTTDLRLSNNAVGGIGLAEITLLPDISYDDPPAVRRYLIPASGELLIPDVLAQALGVGGARGALVVELLADPSAAVLEAEVRVRSVQDADGSSGCSPPAIPQGQWTAAQQEIGGIDLFSDETATFHVANLDSAPGSVRLDLYDGVGGLVGSAVFDLAAGASRQRELGDLFRGLASRVEPFEARFESAGVRFSAAIVAAGHGESVRCAVAAP